jgi:hypothetical protein
MHDAQEIDHALAFVEEVLRTGLMLVELLEELLEELPQDAWPGEEPGAVLLEMMAGSFSPAAAAAGQAGLRQATALVGALGDRTLADLRTAADRAARRG